jgi:hypothetical protein
MLKLLPLLMLAVLPALGQFSSTASYIRKVTADPTGGACSPSNAVVSYNGTVFSCVASVWTASGGSFPVASEAEAIAGADNADGITPLRLAQGIGAIKCSVSANTLSATAGSVLHQTVSQSIAAATVGMGVFAGSTDLFVYVPPGGTQIRIGHNVATGQLSLTGADEATSITSTTIPYGSYLICSVPVTSGTLGAVTHYTSVAKTNETTCSGSGVTVTDSGGVRTCVITAGTAEDTAYDATSWNGDTDAPSKNAVRDQIELMLGSILSVAGRGFFAPFALSEMLNGGSVLASNNDTRTTQMPPMQSTQTFSKMAIHILIAGGAGSTFRLALYASSAVDGTCTGTPLAYTDTGAADATGSVVVALASPASYTLQRGEVYWYSLSYSDSTMVPATADITVGALLNVEASFPRTGYSADTTGGTAVTFAGLSCGALTANSSRGPAIVTFLP